MLWKYIQVFSACLTLSYFYFTSFNVNYQHIFTQINKLFFKCLPIEDKQDVVHIHNRLLLRHEKEQNNIICNNMNGLRYFHTEWIKSKRERQTSYGITYLWNLTKGYKWNYLQNRHGITDVEDNHSSQGVRGWGGISWEIGTDIYTLLLPSCFRRVRLCATPWTAAYEASPSMGFSSQEHWSGLPFPSPIYTLLDIK